MKSARGFTLVEALIGVVILSIGLLGAAAMLLESLRAHSGALRQIKATGLVRDMAERIRANPRGAERYGSGFPRSGSANCSDGVACDSAQQAEADLAHFSGAVRAAFPRDDTIANVQFEPATDPANINRYVISLHWHGQDSAAGVDGVSLQIVARVTAPLAG
jgi:type IV pilus assembly protein PilV